MLALVVLLSGGALLFEEQFTALASLFSYDKYSELAPENQVLKIAYLFAPQDLFPFSADPAVQSRLIDVYQPLVGLDENFNVQPVLAVYYGLLSENNWTFHIREDVKFHDGKVLSADDVVYSYEQAQKYSGVASDLVESLEKVEKIDDQTLNFVTKKPDPLLLNKLSKLPIIKKDFTDFDHPVGTGPFKVTVVSDLTKIDYQRFEQYWGEQPYFRQLEISAVPDKGERVNGLLEGQIDLLVNVPPDSVDILKEKGISVVTMPSLEVGFVMFNLNDEFFAQKEAREAVARSLNKTVFLDLAYGFAKTVNQFVSNGVFGYDPSITGYTYDLIEASKQLEKITSGFEKVDVKFYYPESLKLLGQYFQEQLDEIGIRVEAIPMTDVKLQDSLSQGTLPFYYLGWRNDSGDALPFLKSILHSKTAGGYGIYNGMNYKNEKVDRLIESAENDFNLQNRLKSMQEAMKIAVEDDLIGVPLFETESLFAHLPDLYFKPRVDSLIYPSTIRMKL